MNHPFHLGKDDLTPGKALEIARGELQVAIAPDTLDRIKKSHADVLAIAQGDKVVYGVNTGFGPLCTTIISKADTTRLQENILRSHSVGVGANVPDEIARLMMISKLHSLSFGYSGIAPATLYRIIWMLENDITPIVPCQGSVGASGDLAPLAHLFLPLIGLGKVIVKGEIFDTSEIYQRYDLPPLTLGPKEGLALINGTQFILAYAVRGLYRMHRCLELADIIGAMSLESILGSAAPFKEKLHQLRPYKGSLHVAYRLRTLLKSSEMVESHENCSRVQDPYSIRCMPQVHGSSRNAWLHLKELVHIELNSVTDNPIILSQYDTISGGNFHGQPLAMPLDYATLAASELGNISDRRTYLLLEGDIEGLPKLLMKNTGINSGFMIPQYTSAALASENKTLCFPASADSIPTSLGQEDHVSMGSISGRKLNQVIDNLENILAVELICAAQAFDYRKPLKSSQILDACHELIRSEIDHAEEDRVFADDIQKAHQLLVSDDIINTAYQTAEKNNIDLKGEMYGLFSIS
ncbi:MAG: histidine ammonia-lyase [Marinoscillum sp.]|jgi:histidine ammonia-lyase